MATCMTVYKNPFFILALTVGSLAALYAVPVGQHRWEQANAVAKPLPACDVYLARQQACIQRHNPNVPFMVLYSQRLNEAGRRWTWATDRQALAAACLRSAAAFDRVATLAGC